MFLKDLAFDLWSYIVVLIFALIWYLLVPDYFILLSLLSLVLYPALSFFIRSKFIKFFNRDKAKK